MRALLFTLASLAAAGTAGASSIETVTAGQNVNNSISAVSCGQCPPLVVKKKTSYIVPDVAPGTERVELKEINGEMKLVRTEAWLGGSPVVFVNKASEADIKAAQATWPAAEHLAAATGNSLPVEAQAAATVNIIDNSAKTAAVTTASMADSAPVTPQDSQSQEVDLQSFELRLK